MTYEWAIAAIPAVVLWDRYPDDRKHWIVLITVAWAVLFISTPLTKVQEKNLGHAIQLSVPVLAWVALRSAAILRRKSMLDLKPVG